MQFLSGFAVFSPALLDLLYYMRLKYECRHHAVPTGFYSTYEELKHDFASFYIQNFVCFYSTYEELKRHRVQPPFTMLTSFYSTYEELKPDTICSI